MADQPQQPQSAPGPHPCEPERNAPANQPGTRDDVHRSIFIVAARLLAYPDRALWSLLPEIAAYLRELPTSDPVTTLLTVTGHLRELGAIELEARYVATFDFNEPTALYLTAHELGDSRRRGQALIELRKLLRAAGFEEATAELPDYLPLVLEFLGHAPAGAPPDALDALDTLERRLAAVCERIYTHLDANNLYRDIFVALRAVLPELPETTEPTEPNPEQRFPQREQADTDEMPYPLHYDGRQ